MPSTSGCTCHSLLKTNGSRSHTQPSFAPLHDMRDQDLRAIHRFIKHLGPASKPAPAYFLPEKEPQAPYILFPQTPQ